jgi:hypothetical protein
MILKINNFEQYPKNIKFTFVFLPALKLKITFIKEKSGR